MVPVNAPPRPDPGGDRADPEQRQRPAVMLAMNRAVPATIASPPPKTRRWGLIFDRASASAPAGLTRRSV